VLTISALDSGCESITLITRLVSGGHPVVSEGEYRIASFGSTREILRGAMSEENVEIVQRLYDALNRDDIEGAIEWLDPAVRYDLSERVFNPAVYEGHDGIRRFAANLAEVWDEFRTEPVEFIDAGETVVVSHRVRARGKGSGVEVELPSSNLYRLRDRRVFAIRMYREHADALEAAGLSE
jgi:ketosteroid isomerase-like protein